MATSQKVRQNQTQVNLLDTVEDMDQSRRYVKKLVGISYCYVSTVLLSIIIILIIIINFI